MGAQPASSEESMGESGAEEEEGEDEEFESANMSESGAGAIPVAAAFDMKQLRATFRNEVRDERRLAAEERKADMERARKANETAAANLKRDVTNAIADLLQQHSVDNAKTLEAGIGRAQSVAATSAQTAMKSIVGPSIDAAVRAQMETSVVPKMEIACSTMFTQVKHTFERGMADLNTELLAARESAAISQATPFVSGLKQATSEVRQAATALMTDIPNQVSQALAKTSAPAHAPAAMAPPSGMSKSVPQGK